MTEFRLAHGADPLSTARAERLVAQAGAKGLALELVPVAGGVDAVRTAVRDERADSALLAAPDAIESAAGLGAVVVPKRGDARDAVWLREGAALDALPEGARVGVTNALRRAQLLEQHPALAPVEVDGTAEWADLDVEGVVLAAADAQVLGRAEQLAERLEVDDWPPAPAQGAVLVEMPTGTRAPKGLQALHHPRSAALVEAELAVSRALGAPALLSVNAFVDDGLLFVTARWYDADGGAAITCSHAAEVSGLGAAEFATEAGEVATRVVAEMTSRREERGAE